MGRTKHGRLPQRAPRLPVQLRGKGSGRKGRPDCLGIRQRRRIHQRTHRKELHEIPERLRGRRRRMDYHHATLHPAGNDGAQQGKGYRRRPKATRQDPEENRGGIRNPACGCVTALGKTLATGNPILQPNDELHQPPHKGGNDALRGCTHKPVRKHHP